jgi:U3 small nucleolar ribonucleoprotein protein IMP4
LFLVTTSHRPSQRLRSFVKDLTLILPGSVRVTRGKRRLVDLAYLALLLKKKYLVVATNKKGNPAVIHVYVVHYDAEGKVTASKYFDMLLGGVRLSREGGAKLTAPITSYSSVDESGCSSNKCLELAGLLMSLLKDFINKSSAFKISLQDEGGNVTVKILSRNGYVVGPLLKVRGFKTYGEQG